jgi:hypothetical protein
MACRLGVGESDIVLPITGQKIALWPIVTASLRVYAYENKFGRAERSWRHGRNAMDGSESKRRGWSWWYLLFVVQFVGALWPPLYNSLEPQWIGIPFFYWSQLAMVIVGAVFTAIVYFATDA